MHSLLNSIADSWLFWIVATLLAMTGTTGGLYALYCGLRTSDRADGTVVELEASDNSDGDTFYRPVVVFNADGREQRFTHPVGRHPAGHHVGQTVKVYYRPESPERAQIGRWGFVWPCVMLAAVGWGVMLLAVWWKGI